MTSEKASDRTSETNRPSNITNSNSNHSTNNQLSSATKDTSPKSPPAESSPTKSKHKRNRRRSAQNKKQAAIGQSETHNETTDEPDNHSPTQPSSTMPGQRAQQQDNQINMSEPVKEASRTSKVNEHSKEKHNPANESGKKHVDLLKEKLKENKELRDQLKAKNVQVHTLNDHIKMLIAKNKDLESSSTVATKTCNSLKDLLYQERTQRNKLETEIEGQNQTISRLKAQVSAQEKQKSQDDEMIRVLNATLIERETEVSILKLKMTRLQTNSSAIPRNNDATITTLPTTETRREFALPGRSNSEFCRNSYVRSSMTAETTSRSTVSNQHIDKDASVWATVPEELTPSKRPLILERSFLNDYADSHYASQPTTPIMRDRRYRTLPKSIKSPSLETEKKSDDTSKLTTQCFVTNLDDSSSTNNSSGNKTMETSNKAVASVENHTQNDDKMSNTQENSNSENPKLLKEADQKQQDTTAKTCDVRLDTMRNSPDMNVVQSSISESPETNQTKTPLTPSKLAGVKRLFGRFRRTDSTSSTNSDLKEIEEEFAQQPLSSFQRSANRSTLAPASVRNAANLSKQPSFVTERPFAEWNTDMLADWLTMIGLSMYANQCRRWVRCGAHIMNATPVEVDKGLGITNHLHRKKLRLAISELNGDCDRITKAAAKLDYLWVARWLDDIGLPQYKDAFINARVDGRVLNYLTVDDLISLGVKSLLHHSSIKCGIKILRSINFNLNLLKRRATAAEREQIDTLSKQINETSDEPSSIVNKYVTSEANFGEDADVPLWTCHRVMEWLRMIDFAEFAPNLRGSGVHGGLLFLEDGFNADTMCSLLSIPLTRTLLRRHLSTFFDKLIGKDLASRKREYMDSPTNTHLNPLAEVKAPKKSKLWFAKFKSSSKVGQDGMDEYLCPMYPIEPHLIKTSTRKGEGSSRRDCASLPKIPESINI